MSAANSTFNAGDLIDKTLVARGRVSVYRDAVDNAVSFGTVAPGQPIGVVYAYLSPSAGNGRSGLWWMFQEIGGLQNYYVPHKVGAFDISNLRAQGVISTEEKVRAEQEKVDRENLPWYEMLIKKYGLWVLGTAIAIKAVPALINKKFK